MHPILFSLGPIRLPTYGALVVTALLVGLWTAVRLGRREGLDAGRLFDFTTWMIIVALLGAKFLMVLTNWSYYAEYPRQLFSSATFLAGGVFYGGFTAAILFALWYTRKYRLPARKVFDAYSPAVALGLGIGRLGCFAAGCDYGKPAASSTSKYRPPADSSAKDFSAERSICGRRISRLGRDTRTSRMSSVSLRSAAPATESGTRALIR